MDFFLRFFKQKTLWLVQTTTTTTTTTTNKLQLNQQTKLQTNAQQTTSKSTNNEIKKMTTNKYPQTQDRYVSPLGLSPKDLNVFTCELSVCRSQSFAEWRKFVQQARQVQRKKGSVCWRCMGGKEGIWKDE